MEKNYTDSRKFEREGSLVGVSEMGHHLHFRFPNCFCDDAAL